MKRLLYLDAALGAALPVASHAIPILTTTNCDAAGAYTCLTRIENFEVDGQAYNADFVRAHIFDLFDIDAAGDVLAQFAPLEGAHFWGNEQGARSFSIALSLLMVDLGIDGFLCGENIYGCATQPHTFAYVPSYLLSPVYPPIELAGCMIGTRGALTFCGEFGNTRNWAVITPVPEPATLLLFSSAIAGLALVRRLPSERRSEHGEEEEERPEGR